MNSFSNWLNKNKYELLINRNNSGICDIRDTNDGSRNLVKVLDVKELDSKVVTNIVKEMNRVNNLNINGLMKYKKIEVDDNKLHRMMREYKIHLDNIDPIKYFEESGIFDVLDGIITILKSLSDIGTIHSDLKPSNIFLNEDDEVILSDYLNNSLFKGREGYQALRKINDLCFVCIDELTGKELDTESDIWNFGLVFYYLKTGKYPFAGSSILETTRNIENVKYVRLEGDYSEELNKFLKKILQREKKNRMQLDEIINGLKKLNEPEIPSAPFAQPQEEIHIVEGLRYCIDLAISQCPENGYKLWTGELDMRDEGMKYFCSKMELIRNVKFIDLRVNYITQVGLTRFSQNLKYIPNLEILWINLNPVGDEGIRSLSENLHYVPKMLNLGLSVCNIGNNGIRYLSNHFKDIPKLIMIGLTENSIGNNGVKSLCSNLHLLPNLEILHLDSNSIGDEGAETLINNLHKCPKLEKLSTINNRLSNYNNFKRRLLERHPNKSLTIDSDR